MNIFDQYGIKEVADVTLYSIHRKQDNSGDVYYMPALYLDTLKISTTEQTGENTWARGGRGNSKLISWDHNKEITVNLEDALCTPAELSFCYNGILSADWQDAQVKLKTNVCGCDNPVNRISRVEKAIYPRSGNDPEKHVISNLLPQTRKEKKYLDMLTKSEVVDGTKIQGNGLVDGHNYRWRLIVESGVRSVAQVPDRFFDNKGRSYPINWNSKVSVFNGEAAAFSNFKDAVIYKIGISQEDVKAKPYIIFDAWMDLHGNKGKKDPEEVASLREYLNEFGENLSGHTVSSVDGEDSNVANHDVNYMENEEGDKKFLSIKDAEYLAIVIDENNNYHAFVANDDNYSYINTTDDSKISWKIPEEGVNLSQFKGLDMWLRFESINAMIYFMITKYENNILSIIPAYREKPEPYSQTMYRKITKDSEGNIVEIGEWVEERPTDVTELDVIETKMVEPDAVVGHDKTKLVDYDSTSEERVQTEGKLWAYINPRTMAPYDDTYWFHSGEPYYIKSLTIAPENKKLKANKIVIKADQWPGMYMMVGETYIRNRDTGEDQRMQIVIPLCKVKSDQSLTLEAEGEPTTINMTLEVANSRNGELMEINMFEVGTKMIEENGCYYAIDGSSEVLSE